MTEYTDGKTVFTAGALMRFTPAEAATLSPELQQARLGLLRDHRNIGIPVLPIPPVKTLPKGSLRDLQSPRWY